VAKRFTDTEKWSKPWYRKLGSEGRDIWNYFTEKCDAAGIWEVDLDRARFDLGFEVSIERVIEVFRSRVIEVDGGTKLYFLDFVKFQYGELKSASPPHRRIIQRLTELGLLKAIEAVSARVGTTPEEEEEEEDKEEEEEERERDRVILAKAPTPETFHVEQKPKLAPPGASPWHPVFLHALNADPHPDTEDFGKFLVDWGLVEPTLRKNASAVMHRFEGMANFHRWYLTIETSLNKKQNEADRMGLLSFLIKQQAQLVQPPKEKQ
jgi:hypothetical protein